MAFDQVRRLGRAVQDRVADRLVRGSPGPPMGAELRDHPPVAKGPVEELLPHRQQQRRAGGADQRGMEQAVQRGPVLIGVDAGTTFATPEGLRFEIHTPIHHAIVSPRHDTFGVGPRWPDHANLLTPDPQATARQLGRIGDLRPAETLVDDSLVWFCGDNRQHHILGPVHSHAPGFHHDSCEFPEFDMDCRLGDILDRKDRQILWGAGRRRPGDNTYACSLDASGAMVECPGPWRRSETSGISGRASSPTSRGPASCAR